MFDEQKHLQINTDNSEITKPDHNEQVNCLFKLIAATQDTLPYVCRHPPQSRQCVFLRTPRLNEWSPHPRLDSIYSLNLYSIHPIKNKISCCSVITCDYRHRCHRWHFAFAALALTAPCTGIVELKEIRWDAQDYPALHWLVWLNTVLGLWVELDATVVLQSALKYINILYIIYTYIYIFFSCHTLTCVKITFFIALQQKLKCH